MLRKRFRLSWALPVLLLSAATVEAQAACRQVGGDAFIDHVFDVAYTPVPDQRLGATSGSVFIACDSPGETYGSMLPTLMGMTYVRDVWHSDTDSLAPAYEFAPGSALLVFNFDSEPYDCPVECAIEEIEHSTLVLRDGAVSPLQRMGSEPKAKVDVRITVFSRGGPMESTAARPVGRATTTISGVTANHHLTIGTRFVAQTCAVTPQTVTLDPVDARTLEAQPTAGDKTFNVAVSCAASGRPVVLGMQDVHDPGSTATALAPAPGSTASGVALQVLHQGAPVQMRKPWDHTATSGAAMSVPFSARYLRTAGALKGGAIRGEVTLLADYY
ncbi:fimbrial protein [Stenotrophomonas sp. ATs4]|uniref:fimbrial protein n=1 Tax=Stenotrophomonas sp. ATs4 TaxID=3402766 RepID=UPI003F72198D